MRLTFSIEGLRETQAAIRGFSDRRLAAAAATALTRTAHETRADVQEQMSSIFDRPTPYTLGGIGSRGTNATELESEVFVKDQQSGGRGRPAAKFLGPSIRGGTRRTKGMERLIEAIGGLPTGTYAVPGSRAVLDQHGNLRKALLDTVIAQLRAVPAVGPVSPKRFIKPVRALGGVAFVLRTGRKPGVYVRDIAGTNISPVVIFRSVAPTYTKQFDFVGIASRLAQQRLGPNLRRAIAESAARLAAR